MTTPFSHLIRQARGTEDLPLPGIYVFLLTENPRDAVSEIEGPGLP